MSTLFWNYFFDYFLGAAHAPLAGGAAVDSFGSTKTGRLPRSSAPFLYFSRRITCNSSGFAKQNLSPFKKGWILNFLCQPPFPRDRAQQSKRFGPAYPHPAEEKLSIPHQIQSSRSDTFTCPEGTYITGPKGLYHNAQHYITRPQGGYHWNEKAGRVSVLLLVPSYTPYFAVETLTPGPMVEATTQLLK